MSSSYKASKLTNGTSRRHHYITQDWIMLTARPPKHDNDPFLRLQYKVRRSKLKPFAPLYHERLAEEEKATGTRKKRMPPLENSPTLPKLVSPRDLPTSTGMDEEMQVDAPDETVQLRGSVRSLQWLTRQWEHSTERYNSWKVRKSICEPIKEELVSVPASGEGPARLETVAEHVDGDSWSEILGEKVDLNVGCGMNDAARNRFEKHGGLENQTAKATVFGALLDSQQHFPEESVSSEEEARVKRRDADKKMGLVKVPEIHQRKYRRLRRATKELIAWIESLRPDKPLNFRLVTNLDGTKTNVPMKPYVPYPEEEQPCPVINEDEVVEMVRNSYGSRPAMTLRVAVRDMERLPEELEKFDNVPYLKRKVLEDRMYSRPKKMVATADIKPITWYNFDFHQGKARSRRISAVGTIFDAQSKRHCRYGAWYLRRSLWRKIDTIEDIRKPSGHDSDEAFERATGQKRLQAVDSVLPPSATDDSQAAAAASDIAHLHSAKEFYKLLRSRGRHIPRWLRACEGTLQQTEIDEATRTAPYGSEVWRSARAVKNQPTACHAPGTPMESLLRADLYCHDTGYVKPSHLTKKRSEEVLISGLNPECYAFLEELERVTSPQI